jgi:hypothetical protein
VMKYSWKQRRWRTYGVTDVDEAAGWYAEGYREEACAHPTHAIDGRRLGRGRCNEGFHMLSLAAGEAEAWCCGAGSGAVARRRTASITVEKPIVSCRKSFLNRPRGREPAS